ncbi:MAG: trigger factor [Lachnospiraceae bacterium]|nr:trigger factor [Lachnospiraceae bacterium]
MNVQVENLEKNMVKLTIEIPEEQVEPALNKAYLKERNRIRIDGFRKGKVPRQIIEKMYGPEVFYEEAANILIQDNYEEAMDESGVDIVSSPSMEIVQIEKGKPFIFTAEVAKRPEVKLGQYKGVKVKKVDTSVTDEDVEGEIEKERNRNARSVEKEGEIAEGDTAEIDFEGFLDGEPFEGGKGEGHSLEIGSHSFIDGFEEQLVGKKAGEETELNVTFPEDYHEESLAGKPVVFKVKIHTVRSKEVPELDQDFAEDQGFDSVEEYREDVRKRLVDIKEMDARRQKEDEAIEKIMDSSEMEIPDAMIDSQVNTMLKGFAQRMAGQGLSMKQYMQFTGTDVDALKEQTRPEAIKRIRSSLVLEAIAKEESLNATDEEVEEEIGKMAERYGMEKEKFLEAMGENERENVKRDLNIEKAIDLILDNCEEE